jgi:hypothetical protein
MVNDSMMSARCPEAFDGSPAVAALKVQPTEWMEGFAVQNRNRDT